MNCREALQHLYDYLDKELTEDVAKKIEAHLTICEHCFDKYEFEKMLQEFVSKRGQMEVDAEPLKAKVLQRISELDNPKGSGGFLSKFRPYFAAAIAVVVIALTLVTSLNHSSSDIYAALHPFVSNHMQTVVAAETPMIPLNEADLESALQKIVHVPDDLLKTTAGRRPKTGEMDECSNKKAAHIVYDYLGDDISVYVIDDMTFKPCPSLDVKKEGDHSYHYGSLDGMNVIMWRCQGVWCVAVAETAVENLMQFASAY
jgi:anti-sigma factor (TIGR02949 family)